MEAILTIMHIFVLSATTTFYVLVFFGKPFVSNYMGSLSAGYNLAFGVAIFEIILTCLQRIALKIADPYPLNSLKEVMSPLKASRRLMFRSIIFPLVFFIVDWFVDGYIKNHWFITYDDLAIVKYVCSMNILIPLCSVISKEIHWKLWITITS